MHHIEAAVSDHKFSEKFRDLMILFRTTLISFTSYRLHPAHRDHQKITTSDASDVESCDHELNNRRLQRFVLLIFFNGKFNQDADQIFITQPTGFP